MNNSNLNRDKVRPILLSEQEIKAASEEYITPLYLYNLNKIEHQYAKLRNYLPPNFKILYTLKANSNLTICAKLAQLGCGADISSIGELKAALKTGFSAPQIVFTGPGKTNLELATAIETGIGIIVVESVKEARRLNNLAQKYGKKQDVLIRINPLYRTNQSCEIRERAGNCGSNDTNGGETGLKIF